jgi:hypothetical protein
MKMASSFLVIELLIIEVLQIVTDCCFSKITDPGYPRSDFSDGFRGNGNVDVGESPTDAMMHSMPDFSSSTGKEKKT